MRCLPAPGPNQFHDSPPSISKVDTQHSSLRAFPMYPTSHYHEKGRHLRKRGPQGTTPLARLEGHFGNE